MPLLRVWPKPAFPTLGALTPIFSPGDSWRLFARSPLRPEWYARDCMFPRPLFPPAKSGGPEPTASQLHSPPCINPPEDVGLLIALLGFQSQTVQLPVPPRSGTLQSLPPPSLPPLSLFICFSPPPSLPPSLSPSPSLSELTRSPNLLNAYCFRRKQWRME